MRYNDGGGSSYDSTAKNFTRMRKRRIEYAFADYLKADNLICDV